MSPPGCFVSLSDGYPKFEIIIEYVIKKVVYEKAPMLTFLKVLKYIIFIFRIIFFREKKLDKEIRKIRDMGEKKEY